MSEAPTVAVLGAGQLARMMALAAAPLGVRVRTLDPSPSACAGPVTEQIVGAYDDPEALDRLGEGAAVATYEFENVPFGAAEHLARSGVAVHPSPSALAVSQDRLSERELFARLEIATPEFVAIDSLAALQDIAASWTPGLLKARRLGYDGKGQFLLMDPGDSERAWESIGGVPALLDRFVEFTRELSLIGVRGRGADGETDVRFYPLVENVHRGGILRLSRAPATNVSASVQAEAERAAWAIMEETDYIGVLAVEFFEVNGRLLANEIAPRVHNSGHWSIEGAPTSQFENHLRAVLGLPLGPVEPEGHSAMINLIGTAPSADAVLAVPGAHLHLYGKEGRPGRKIGHVTLSAPGRDEVSAMLERFTRIIA